jgi:hypothetical protein
MRRDVCTIDRADRAVLMSCEKTRVTNPGGGGPNPGGGGATKCVAAQEAKQLASEKASGESRAAARGQLRPRFSQAFYATTITLKGSADGLDGQGNLPITIDQVCVPKSLAREALQIAGGSGVVSISPGTKVFQAGRLLQGPAATTAVAGADSVTVRARLKRGNWGRDEDGTPIPTFAASRTTITD